MPNEGDDANVENHVEGHGIATTTTTTTTTPASQGPLLLGPIRFRLTRQKLSDAVVGARTKRKNPRRGPTRKRSKQARCEMHPIFERLGLARTKGQVNILIVGEMDFSFAMDCSLYLQPGIHHITATTFFDTAEVPKKIKRLVQNSIRVLRKRGVDVQTTVDATKLDDGHNLNRTLDHSTNELAAAAQEGPHNDSSLVSGDITRRLSRDDGTPACCSPRLFDRVIFCFPRGSSVSGIRSENDELLNGFFKTAAKVLAPNGYEIAGLQTPIQI
eukprot:INCI17178.3.p1 GENE.INCI17178.3~~INCI17178.3.p1  ORF type:complete len:272 (+),score=46.41 INCI17178.3:201-1016(+)